MKKSDMEKGSISRNEIEKSICADRQIEDMIHLEWEMFSNVDNEGGKAECQNRPDTFWIMRKSQFLAWTSEIRESYLLDLKQAKKAERNLCAEKYGYMMESTFPEEYEEIKDLLPDVDKAKMEQIWRIVQINLEWEQEMDEKYKKLRANGRPLRKERDTQYETSVETYMTGELKTYSEKTIQLLYEYTVRCKENGRNLAYEILKNMVTEYGYDSVEAAEAQI